ncbi:hypothetical protein EV126DRAFT_159299 [Verticillium dahliae]|nr:hypothetical protein EV126DRAFT_159299 [Verticillium dahliae]
MSRCPVSGCYLDCAGRNVMPQRDEPVSLYFPTVSQVRQGHTGRGLGRLVNNTTRPRWFALLCFRSCRRAIMMFRNFMQLNTSSFCRVDRVSVSCRPDMHRRRLETPAVHLGKCPLSLREIQIASSVVRVFDESRHRFGQDTAAVITSFELSTMMKSSSPVRVSKQNVRPASHPNVKHCASRTAFVACQFPSNRRSIIARHNGRGIVF